MEAQKLSLKREVGLVGAVSLIGGTMIGSGIFMSPQTVLATIGSPGASLVVWACCGLLVILASFCYAELGTVIRESGGEYIYILRTSGPVVAFMLIFSSVLFARPAGVAGIALSFAQYVVAPFYSECAPPVLLVKCVAAAAIFTLATVNCLNVRFSMSVQVFFMVAKVLALAVIIVGGVVMLSSGHTENFTDSFENTNVGISSIGIAFYQGLWSFDGWNNLNYVTEELKRPEEQSVWFLGLDHVYSCSSVSFWVIERDVFQWRSRVLCCRPRRTHARHSSHGSRAQADSFSSTDFHHRGLPAGAHPRRLSEYCQLLQVNTVSLLGFSTRSHCLGSSISRLRSRSSQGRTRSPFLFPYWSSSQQCSLCWLLSLTIPRSSTSM
ncbi:b(0,+)-type amino acid transporter 1 isoform X2 [Dunckerocampus dactyliophorus]|uniref:b(0,+)-type amino acid transporter 1 isoform X2 n=1 Tax=Dunckerocampus dactyliophorus TaxID=161453 RepID=UPI0024061FC6|nr:b(0,+)-type amino acid transporter 1 isoform X2 [Dunckerocampus dactyliophorus]